MPVSPLTSEFASRLAPTFKKEGFRKTGATWHRDFERMIQVFNIQKSQWGDQFYLNMGIYLKDLGNETRPTEYRCHVRCRAERIVQSAEFSKLQECLDFDTPVAREQRYARLQRLIEERVVPWFEANTTPEALGKLLREDPKGFAIMRGVPELLSFDMGRQRYIPDPKP